MNKFKNLKFYVLCRNKLNLNKSDIYREVKDILKEDALLPPECIITEWIDIYNKEPNPGKKDKLISLSFKKDIKRSIKPEPKAILQSKQYALFRFKLIHNHQQILDEIKQLFKNYLPSLKTVKSWFKKIQHKEIESKSIRLSAEVELLNLKLIFEKDLAAANSAKLEQKNQEIAALQTQLEREREQKDRKIYDLCQSNRQMFSALAQIRPEAELSKQYKAELDSLKKNIGKQLEIQTESFKHKMNCLKKESNDLQIKCASLKNEIKNLNTHIEKEKAKREIQKKTV